MKILEKKIKVKVNLVYKKYLKCESTYQIFFGSASSGKSYFLGGQRCPLSVLNDNKNWLIVRKVEKTLRDSTFNEVKKAIVKLGFSDIFKINETTMIITCLINQKQIYFRGLDDVEKLKSTTPINGNIDVIWIEEATETSEADLNILEKRQRGKEEGKEDGRKFIIFSFNPIFQTHWIRKRFFIPIAWEKNQKFYSSKELSILKTTYKDNEFLTLDDIKRIEDTKDSYTKQVYVEGDWGVLSGTIFKNWSVQDISKIIPNFDNIRNGLDFGATGSPDAFIRSHLDKKRKRLFIFDDFYLFESTNPVLAEKIKRIIDKDLVVCDCAEPKSIRELCQNGVKAVAAQKGKDSVEFGLKWLRGLEIIIHTSCQYFINEITFFRLAVDKNGNAFPGKYLGLHHCLDALRYSWEIEMLKHEDEFSKTEDYVGGYQIQH